MADLGADFRLATTNLAGECHGVFTAPAISAHRQMIMA